MNSTCWIVVKGNQVLYRAVSGWIWGNINDPDVLIAALLSMYEIAYGYADMYGGRVAAVDFIVAV